MKRKAVCGLVIVKIIIPPTWINEWLIPESIKGRVNVDKMSCQNAKNMLG